MDAVIIRPAMDEVDLSAFRERLRTEVKPCTRIMNGQQVSQRERQVILAVQTGATNGEIGRLFFIAEDTVKTHLRRIYRKFGVRNRTELAIKVRRYGTPTDAVLASVLADESLETHLSAREAEVLRLIADGSNNKEIASALGLSALTVKSHLARISRKLNTGDRTLMAILFVCQTESTSAA